MKLQYQEHIYQTSCNHSHNHKIENRENINNLCTSDTPTGDWGFNRQTSDSNEIYGNSQYGKKLNGNKYGGKQAATEWTLAI